MNYIIWMEDEAAVELYIDTGDAAENKSLFDRLITNRPAIESSFGGPLSWERLDTKRACRVRSIIKLGGLKSGEERWPKIWDAMVDAMGRLSNSLRPYIGTA